MEKIIDTKEAARLLNTTPRYIQALTTAGKLVPSQVVGRTNIFTMDEIERYKAERRPRGRPFGTKKKEKENEET